MKYSRLFIATCLLAGTFVFTGCNQTNTAEETETIVDSEAIAENPFAYMKTTDFNGKSVDSSLFADNTLTLVNVWNISCTPCVDEIPALDELNTAYADKGVCVVGLYDDFSMGISDDEAKEIQSILTDADASYKQLRLDGTLASNDTLLNIAVFPTTYVVDSQGMIIDTVEGTNDFEGWSFVVDAYLTQLEE